MPTKILMYMKIKLYKNDKTKYLPFPKLWEWDLGSIGNKNTYKQYSIKCKSS